MMTRTTVAAAALFALAAAASVPMGAQAPAKAAAAPTFNKEVAPILYKNCTNCHRPGEIAPMSLLTFKDVRPWVKSIATQVSKGAMPPWHADPSHGEFLNDRAAARRALDDIRGLYEKRVAYLVPQLKKAGLRPACATEAGFFTLWKVPESVLGRKLPAENRHEAFNRAVISAT